MPNLKTLHNKLQKISQTLQVNFRQFRHQGIPLSPNPYVKNQSINARTRTQAISQTVNSAGFEGYQVYIDAQGLIDSGINPTTALAPAAEWAMSEDSGDSFIPLTIFNKPIKQSSRYIVTFLRRISEANLAILYQEPVGGTTPDTDGNPIPNYNLRELKCVMNQGSSTVSSSGVPGVTPASIFLEGRCLSPLALPAEISPLRQYEARIDDHFTGNEIAGRFIVRPTLQDAWTADSQSQGSKISGWFTLLG